MQLRRKFYEVLMKKDKKEKREKNKEKKKKDRTDWKSVYKNSVYALGFIARSAPSVIVVSFSLAIMGAAASFLSGTYMYKYALNAIQEGKSLRGTLPVLAIILAFSVFYSILVKLGNYYCEIKNQKVTAYINNLVYKKATEVELACFEDPEFYDSYVVASSNAASCAFDVLNDISRFISVIFSTVAIGGVMISVDWIFLILAFVPLVVTMLTGKKRNNAYYERYMEARRATREKEYVKRTFYLSDFSKEMRLTRMHRVMYRNMSESVRELKVIQKKYGKKFMFFRQLRFVVYEPIVHMGTIVLAAFKTLVKKNMLIGDCFVVINSIDSIATNIEAVGDTFNSFSGSAMYIESVRSFFEYESKMPEDESAPLVPAFESLELRDVSYKYAKSQKEALSGVSLKINKGERIAIVGHNGAGKSTLVRLLMRLYDADSGEVLINGENIKNYRLSSYRALFGTVFQDYGLFAASIAENVLLKTDITDEDRIKVRDALRKSDILEKIEALPRGIDTEVTREFDDKGAVFSGGEAQKIAIARIFAGESEIVIMDEPTSALDPIAEHKMYQNMFEACEGKTVIFISHRISSATMADRIYLFEDGKICEAGCHSELLVLGAKYADMWHKQADSYTEEVSENG